MINRRFALAAMALLATLPLQLSGAEASNGVLKTKQLKELVASAKTAEDHERLARHYSAVAAVHETDAVEHESLAQFYAKNPQPAAKMPMAPNTAEHCKYYAQHCRNAAKEMRAMASMHEDLANAQRSNSKR